MLAALSEDLVPDKAASYGSKTFDDLIVNKNEIEHSGPLPADSPSGKINPAIQL